MTYKDSAAYQSLLLVIGIVVIGSNSFVLSPILSNVAASLHTTPVAITRVISAYGAATALSAFALAGLIDRFGVRRVLIASAGTLCLALALSAASRSWLMLTIAQTLAGLAGGVMLPAIYTTTTAIAPEGQGARLLSRVLTGWAVSLVAGVPLSAFLTDLASWRLAYALLALVAAIACVGFRDLPETDTAPRTASSQPWKALAIPGVGLLLAICLCFMTAFYGTYALIGVYLRQELLISAGEVSLVVLTYGAGFGLAGFASGLVDRLGPSRVYPVILAVVAVIYLAMPQTTGTLAAAAATTFVWGAFNHYGLNILVLLLSRCSQTARGAVMGVNSTTTYLAVFAGPLLMGFLYQDYGFAAVSVASSGLLVIGALLSVAAARNAGAAAHAGTGAPDRV